jgi:deazaflavin-dependent oxidoreductase (nitroreductase family)
VSRFADAADDDFCYLTTLGRVSGDPHEIEIWFAIDGATVFMLAGAGTRSDWVRNLQRSPHVTVRLREETYEARARVVDDPVEDRRARTLLFDKYEPRNPGLASWRESALPIALDVTTGG